MEGWKRRRKGKMRRARCFVRRSTVVEAGGAGAVETCPGGGEARPGRLRVRAAWLTSGATCTLDGPKVFGEMPRPRLRVVGTGLRFVRNLSASTRQEIPYARPTLLDLDNRPLRLALLTDDWLTRRSIPKNGEHKQSEIQGITKNFSEKLGEGGFGCVFKGTMAVSTSVAVKRLKGMVQGDKQFRAEVQTIGMIQHINLVRLLGFCAAGRKRLLVYDCMVNGSLSSHLFSENSAKLSWELRYRIALGTARGLAYLHEECEDCIVHCDLKPDNILLDELFCPKIADFGMAKLLGRDYSRVLTTMRGTIGYLAPEWISGVPITHKADVYSFGIMLLEIISGRRNSEKIKMGRFTYFPSYVAVKLNEGDDVMCLLDGSLEGNADAEQLERACRVACWCLQDSEDHRPMMGQVVRMLEGVMDVQVPPVPRSLQNYVGMEDSSSADMDSF